MIVLVIQQKVSMTFTIMLDSHIFFKKYLSEGNFILWEWKTSNTGLQKI